MGLYPMAGRVPLPDPALLHTPPPRRSFIISPGRCGVHAQQQQSTHRHTTLNHNTRRGLLPNGLSCAFARPLLSSPSAPIIICPPLAPAVYESRGLRPILKTHQHTTHLLTTPSFPSSSSSSYHTHPPIHSTLTISYGRHRRATRPVPHPRHH